MLWSLTRRLNWRNESRNINGFVEAIITPTFASSSLPQKNWIDSNRCISMQWICTTLLTTPNARNQKARQPRTTSLHISGSPKRVHVPLSIMGALILQNEVAIDDDDHRQLIVWFVATTMVSILIAAAAANANATTAASTALRWSLYDNRPSPLTPKLFPTTILPSFFVFFFEGKQTHFFAVERREEEK